MVVMYILNDDVSFNEEDGYLQNEAAGASVLMAASTRRLLSVLVANQGNPVTRDTLFKMVWDDHGMRSSDSNLNQYISILRKQLGQVGLPDDAIITIPRVGFMFNPEINVRNERPVTAVPVSRMNNRLRSLVSGRLYYPAFTLCVFLLCVSMLFIFFYDREPEEAALNSLSGYPPACRVYALPGRGATNKRELDPVIAEKCNGGSVYFIFNHPGPAGDRLTVSCEKGAAGYFTHCYNRRDEAG